MIEYKVIHHHINDQFEIAVNMCLKDGWELQDFFVDRGEKYQTLVREVITSTEAAIRFELDPAGLGTLSRGEMPQPHFERDAHV